MKIFRIDLFLTIKVFFKSIFLSLKKKDYESKIKKILCKNSAKNDFLFTSQCRIALLIVLKFLKIKFPKKDEIIFTAYNLPEMVNVAENLNFKAILCDLDYNAGFYDFRMLKKKINKKTSAIVLTNMFNSYQQSKKLKKICNEKKVYLIEDNAIYFDNFIFSKDRKKYSGSSGDFTLYSFNIMKNISALYGGGVASNIKDFNLYGKKQISTFANFPKLILLRQIFIFFILKVLAIGFLYKYFFFNIIKFAHTYKINFLLKIFYPLLKFKVRNFPDYYFTNITPLSKKLIYYQLIDSKERSKNHESRKLKNIYYLNSLKKIKTNKIKLFSIKDFNYQNFIDFPLLVKNRDKLNNFLLSRGIEARLYYYKNCEKIFKKKMTFCKNSKKFENEIICLPNNNKIKLEYIDYIVNSISLFFLRKKIN